MRYSITKPINQRLSCTAFELSVGQLLSVLWLMNDYEYPTQINEFALAHADDLLNKARDLFQFSKPTDLRKLTKDDAEKVQALFFEVNKAFFEGESEESEFEEIFVETLTGKEFYQHLSSNVDVLIRLGHKDALSYPFSFYLTTLENINESNNG